MFSFPTAGMTGSAEDSRQKLKNTLNFHFIARGWSEISAPIQGQDRGDDPDCSTLQSIPSYYVTHKGIQLG